MENVRRIYTLLSQSNGLKIREIAQKLGLDKLDLACILYSTDNYPYWYQDDSSLWYAKEDAIEIEKPKEDKFTESIVASKSSNVDRFLKGNPSISLRLYINQIKRYRGLSNDEIVNLLKRYKHGDQRAYELIVESKQKLVASIALIYYKHGIPLEDLIQEGNFGLLRAIENFDYINYSNFTNYAKNWIIQSISNSIHQLPYMIHLPFNRWDTYRKVCRFREKFEQENGYRPSLYDIEIDENLNFKYINAIYKLPDDLKELIVFSDELDAFESETNSIVEYEEKESNKLLVKKLLNRLKDRHKYILESYYGINSPERNLLDIGDELNLTRERVRQIVVSSTTKLQRFLGIIKKAQVNDIIMLHPSGKWGRVTSVTKKDDGTSLLRIKMDNGVIEEHVEENIYFSILDKIPEKKIIKISGDNKSNKRTHLHQSVSDYNVKRKKEIEERRKRVEERMKQVKEERRMEEERKRIEEEKKRIEEKRKQMEEKNKAKGDRIIYDEKRGTIVGIYESNGRERIIIQYDDGKLDNVLADKNRYKII